MRRERRVVARLEVEDAHDHEEREDGELQADHHRVRPRALLDAVGEHDADGEHEHDGGEVDRAAVAGRPGDRVRQVDAEQRAEQVLDVPAPADGDGRDGHPVLEDEVPADDPGDELAQRRVAVRVGASGDRDGGGELRVAQRREDAGHPGEHEGQDDRRTGLADRLADDHEDPGADDRADAQRGQVEGADGALQAAVLRLLNQLVRGLASPGARRSPLECLRRHAASLADLREGVLPGGLSAQTALPPEPPRRAARRASPRASRRTRRRRPGAR